MSLSDWFRNSGVWPHETVDDIKAQLAKTMAKTRAELKQDNTDPHDEDGEHHEQQR